MSRLIIVNGAKLQLPAKFGDITLSPPPASVPVHGSGHATIDGQQVCLQGDEKSIRILCAYTTQKATIPGTVLISITRAEVSVVALSPEPVIVAQQWTALCQVTVPAQIPGSPPTPEPHVDVTEQVSVIDNPNTFVTVED